MPVTAPISGVVENGWRYWLASCCPSVELTNAGSATVVVVFRWLARARRSRPAASRRGRGGPAGSGARS